MEREELLHTTKSGTHGGEEVDGGTEGEVVALKVKEGHGTVTTGSGTGGKN